MEFILRGAGARGLVGWGGGDVEWWVVVVGWMDGWMGGEWGEESGGWVWGR